MVLILEVPLASIAIILSAVSLRTLRELRSLSVGKSFWVPILFSGIFFFAASVIAILSEISFSFIPYAVEIVSISRLVALCFIAGGVYTYSRRINKTLVETLTHPEKPMEMNVESNAETKSSESNVERWDEKTVEKKENCRHQLGYLRTLQKDAHIPEECLGCHRIIECKYSMVKEVKSTVASPTTSKTILAEAGLEEENPNRSG